MESKQWLGMKKNQSSFSNWVVTEQKQANNKTTQLLFSPACINWRRRRRRKSLDLLINRKFSLFFSWCIFSGLCVPWCENFSPALFKCEKFTRNHAWRSRLKAGMWLEIFHLQTSIWVIFSWRSGIGHLYIRLGLSLKVT